jgi:hypothetical protein
MRRIATHVGRIAVCALAAANTGSAPARMVALL